MPSPTVQQNAHRAKVLVGLFWSGVGLAPLAMLITLVASGGMLKVAAVLAMLAVVLIGVSIALRRDPGDGPCRAAATPCWTKWISCAHDVREDLNTAARNTHRALTERIHTVHGGVEALRAQVDELRAQIEEVQTRPIAPMVAHGPGASGAARVGRPRRPPASCTPRPSR